MAEILQGTSACSRPTYEPPPVPVAQDLRCPYCQSYTRWATAAGEKMPLRPLIDPFVVVRLHCQLDLRPYYARFILLIQTPTAVLCWHPSLQWCRSTHRAYDLVCLSETLKILWTWTHQALPSWKFGMSSGESTWLANSQTRLVKMELFLVLYHSRTVGPLELSPSPTRITLLHARRRRGRSGSKASVGLNTVRSNRRNCKPLEAA